MSMKEPSDIPDMYGKIESESSLLGKLASKIPGFSGYIERSRRREADQILRQTIAGRLEQVRLQLANAHNDLSRDIILAIDHAEPLGRVDTCLMGLIGNIKDAPQGYAGFFDAVKIKEDDLARIYVFDEGMMDHVELMAAGVAALEKAVRDGGDVGGTIRALAGYCQEANGAFAARQELMSGAADQERPFDSGSPG